MISTDEVTPGNRASNVTVLAGAFITFLLSCSAFLFSSKVIRHEPAWRTFEFCQYAEIGKNIASGTGYYTRLIEPMALAYVDEHCIGTKSPPWPVINRFPWPCFVTAALMSIMGPTEIAAAWSNGIAISLLAAITFIAAQRFYGTRWASLTILLFLLNPSFYGYFVLLGTPDIWFASWFLLQLLIWIRLLEAHEFCPGQSILFGLISGVCYLTRFNQIIFLVVQLLVLLIRWRWKDVICIALAAIAMTMPLLAYNWKHFGHVTVSIYSAWNLLDQVGAFAVEPWLYYRVPSLLPELVKHSGGVVNKLCSNLFTVVSLRVWTLWHLYLLLPLSLCVPFSKLQMFFNRFFRWSFALFVLQLVVFSGLRLEFEHRLSPHHGRYFFWFAVPCLLGAMGLLTFFAKHRRSLVRWCVPFIISGQLLCYGMTWWSWIVQNREPISLGHDPIRGWLASEIPAGRLVASNQSQILAWYSSLTAVSLPADPNELRALNRGSSAPIDYLFLDLNYNCITLDNRWAELVQPNPGTVPTWERDLLLDYEYVRPPAETRPFLFVLLRHR